MDGTPLGCDAMNNCTDQQYWDALVCQCIPCSLICGRSAVRRCAALCGEWGKALGGPTGQALGQLGLPSSPKHRGM